MPFPLRDIRENPRSNVRGRALGDGAICSENSKNVPYHGANPNARNGARLRCSSPIMAPDIKGGIYNFQKVGVWVQVLSRVALNGRKQKFGYW